jgi:hypothetical protein
MDAQEVSNEPAPASRPDLPCRHVRRALSLPVVPAGCFHPIRGVDSFSTFPVVPAHGNPPFAAASAQVAGESKRDGAPG